MSLTYNQWTPERTELLKQLWTEGHSASQIANKFKGTAFTRSAVIGKVHRLKLPARAPRQPVQRKAKRWANGVPKPPMPPPRPRPPPPPPPPSVAPQTPWMRQLTFFKLEPHHCRFPLGDLLEPARLFCAADKDAREIYCPFHQRRARRDHYNPTDDFARSIDECYAEIRERKAKGGKGWGGWK